MSEVGVGRGVVVAMLTYRRPDDLRIALPAFLAEIEDAGADVTVLVVDNDPDGSAQGYVVGLGHPRVRYVHEPEPGIATARNRALDEARDAELLAFVDDDERPTPGWLARLLETHRAHAPACVVGPVVSEFAEELEPWIAAGRFFDRRRLPTGTPVDVAATNNLLLDMAQVRRHGIRFDPVFGLSGGSDTLFTRALVARGVRFVWCDEAVVLDRVPQARLTRAWVLRRARRSGNSAARVALALAGSAPQRLVTRARYLTRGLVRVAAGGARRALGTVTGSAVHHARGQRSLDRGLGMVTGALGHVVYEYRRD
jgi:glycosyltransferase involved in cell wall biosynthesis